MLYLLRRAWHILVLRVLPIHANQRQDLLYLFRDPWALDDARERRRIQQTSLIIKEQIGPCRDLLEVGCAEGLQSLALRQNCTHLTGVDVSQRAVTRAGRLVRDANFLVVDVFSPKPVPLAPADLVVACEMIYLLADVGAAISKLETLGRACLITYMDQASAKVEPFLANRAIRGRQSIMDGELTWHVVWWNSPEFKAK